MSKLTIDQTAQRCAEQETAGVADRVRAMHARRSAYDRALTRLAQEVESGARRAWGAALSDAAPIEQNHSLLLKLREWLATGRKTKPVDRGYYSDIQRRMVSQIDDEVINEGWKKLYIEDADALAMMPFMNSGHPNFAPELEAAVSAWMALYSDGAADRPKNGAAKALDKWIPANRPGIDNANAKARIATVINPADRKSGGVNSTTK